MVNDRGHKEEMGRTLEKVVSSKGKMLCKEKFMLFG